MEKQREYGRVENTILAWLLVPKRVFCVSRLWNRYQYASMKSSNMFWGDVAVSSAFMHPYSCMAYPRDCSEPTLRTISPTTKISSAIVWFFPKSFRGKAPILLSSFFVVGELFIAIVRSIRANVSQYVNKVLSGSPCMIMCLVLINQSPSTDPAWMEPFSYLPARRFSRSERKIVGLSRCIG